MQEMVKPSDGWNGICCEHWCRHRSKGYYMLWDRDPTLHFSICQMCALYENVDAKKVSFLNFCSWGHEKKILKKSESFLWNPPHWQWNSMKVKVFCEIHLIDSDQPVSNGEPALVCSTPWFHAAHLWRWSSGFKSRSSQNYQLSLNIILRPRSWSWRSRNMKRKWPKIKFICVGNEEKLLPWKSWNDEKRMIPLTHKWFTVTKTSPHFYPPLIKNIPALKNCMKSAGGRIAHTKVSITTSHFWKYVWQWWLQDELTGVCVFSSDWRGSWRWYTFTLIASI